ncbi:hypothetical protein EUGRSUZ_K00984 [Eucalyptus grandis]|uniref:Uncharacterized protein n=2 Tax=Eucalyptus grandis TaxID=71139 RepID=A0ACC3IRV3_EUCGR|nr:hypothetical protein EUGRSUZ_K00984 [Eucalyptus grandis]
MKRKRKSDQEGQRMCESLKVGFTHFLRIGIFTYQLTDHLVTAVPHSLVQSGVAIFVSVSWLRPGKEKLHRPGFPGSSCNVQRRLSAGVRQGDQVFRDEIDDCSDHVITLCFPLMSGCKQIKMR